MKKFTAISLAAAMTACVLSGCSGKKVSDKDGTYEAQSSVYENDDGTDDGNGYGVVSVTITDGKISDCTFTTYEKDGTLKDEDYGKEGGRIANKDYYNKAQKANAACAEYASMLVQNGQLDGIDSISGATINYNEFKEAVGLALKEAQE
jgi:major membrane immunogen (membrane-anchored lipoprotein)